MKTILDAVSGKPITINYVPSSATATMSCGNAFIKEVVPKGSRRRAQWAYTKGDLEAFGSFFE